MFVVPNIPRTDEQKVEEVGRLFDEAIEHRRDTLLREADQLASALKRIVDGQPEEMRTGRWYRVRSQLLLLAPLSKAIHEILARRSHPQARLEAVLTHLELELQASVTAIRNEAQTIANDMEALTLRISLAGHQAELHDIRCAHWYCTASQLLMLKRLYKAVQEVLGVKDGTVVMAADDADSSQVLVLVVPTDLDRALIADEKD